ncbi:hypothetical protein CPB84DRAFT_1758075 [Gymnopilus junonius]|uniref:Uncharacterized protein n=1 Tax=Gymnopilus junonius TaxID=109634 RepID=A0A9P5TU97_GYMJU|nr:hypothetical protein CPB84DRAFT_1758075 [Gymnopilus junonius]
MTLHGSLAPGLEKVKGSNGLGHRYDNAPSEVGLLGSLIMVLKMVYGLDGTAR